MSTAFTLVLSAAALVLLALVVVSMAREWRRQRAIRDVTILAARQLDRRCREKTGQSSPQLAKIVSLTPRGGS